MYQPSRRPVLSTLGCLALVAALAHSAAAQPSRLNFGVRAGEYFHWRTAFLGVELVVPLGHGWRLNPNAEVAFVDPGHLVTGNLDLAYEIPTARPFRLWVGGGPAVAFRNVIIELGKKELVADRTDFGWDFLAGVEWRRERLVPYLQAKALWSGTSEYALCFGVRF
jgi:hypothetical protein